MKDVLEVIKSRRSVRKYKPEQISNESLDKIIEAGIYAPTAHNQQPWHFTVIQNPELLDRINTYVREAMLKSGEEWVNKMASKPNFKVTYDAPTLVVVSGKKDAIAWRADCAAAIQNMLIAAESMEIGSVWLGLMRFFFENKEEMAEMNIPEGYEPYYGISFGYRAYEKALPGPKRNVDVVNYIK
ncbi:MAG: nitroreductase [Eubacterium sp.]|nr:nitroreductase [Eubacterium sp.]